MSVKVIAITSAVLLAAGFTFLSAAKVGPIHKSIDSHEIKFVKPGAAVGLTHDYDGRTGKGELESFTLILDHMYEAGYLTVRLMPPTGLQIQSDLEPHHIQLSTASKFVFPVQFSTREEGTYYLGLETVYESLGGEQSRRVLSIPITVGNRPKGKSQTLESIEPQALSDGIIALPAREVIE